MNKNYTVMELEAIKHLCKCVNSVASLPADLIADTNVATNTTYSSYKIDAEMSALENDIQRYVDTALAGLNKLTKEVIDDKALVVKENVLYLYKDPTSADNNYMQMMLINGVVVELGATEVDFSNIYSKTEADDKFALKIDLDTLTTSFNNLVTSVDKKVDKDKIVTALDDTVTDEQVPSAKVVVDELNTKANDDKVVKKTDIATIIDLSSTDEQVASAKAVYDRLENINDFSVQVVKNNLNLNNITETGIYFFSRTYTPVNTPAGVNGWLLVMKGSYSDIVKQVWYNLGTADTFERYNGGDGWTEWTKFLTETDVVTTIDSSSTDDKVPSAKAVYDELQDLFQSVSDGKTLVANAITDKGVSTATDATFATMATNISKINDGGYKEETVSYNNTSTGANRLVFTFSADVSGVKQIKPPSNISPYIVPETVTSMFTINGKELILYVNGAGTWKVTALIKQ